MCGIISELPCETLATAEFIAAEFLPGTIKLAPILALKTHFGVQFKSLPVYF